MMGYTQQCEVGCQRGSAVAVMIDVVDVAPLPGPLTAHPVRGGEPAGLVALEHRQPLRRAGMPPHIKPQGPPVEERVPAIGLDIEELHASGQPIPVTAALREVAADLSGQAVWRRRAPR